MGTEVVKLADGRETLFAHADLVGPGRWRVRFDSGLSVETDAAADVMGTRTVLCVADLGELRRASFAQARGEHEQRADEHQREQQGQKRAGHAPKVAPRRSGRQSP